MLKILGVIPARGGSKGVPRKNIKLLGNMPLIGFTIKEALSSNLSRVVLSTDDDEISNVAESLGLESFFMRPESLATDNASSLDVAKHALTKCEEIFNESYDGLMLLQPTTPFRRRIDINNCLDLFEQNNFDSVISVVDVDAYHPARMKYIENGLLIDPPFGERKENQNRQELGKMFIRNGAIYLTKRENILNGTFKGKRSGAYIMEKSLSINIDSIHDFELAEFYLSRHEDTSS